MSFNGTYVKKFDKYVYVILKFDSSGSSGIAVQNLDRLLKPRSIAVVGASQRPTRGTGILSNLLQIGFPGKIFAINPNYKDILGCPSFASVADLPEPVDSLVVAVAADAACDVLEQARKHGVGAAVVLSAGFGEGGHGQNRVQRLNALSAGGMALCGPNCFGVLNIKDKVATYSGQVSKSLKLGSLALISQSGGIANNIVHALMTDRHVGFRYVISCGNQIGTTLEDYIGYMVDDADVNLIAVIAESLKNPQKLLQIARNAVAARKTIIMLNIGRSATGQMMVRSHTGALAGNTEVVAAFLRCCGILQVTDYDDFVETIALFAGLPPDAQPGLDLIVLSSSGGGAAIAADVLADDPHSPKLAELSPTTKTTIHDTLPEFGSVTNPIDGTGAIFDDPQLLPNLMTAIVGNGSHSILAASLSARPDNFNEKMRHLARTYADVAAKKKQIVVAFQPTPHGNLDPDIVDTLCNAHVPLLLGTGAAMRALKYLPRRQEYWRQVENGLGASDTGTKSPKSRLTRFDFMSARSALIEANIPIVESTCVHSEDEAIAHFRRLGTAVAIKAEADGLLHKSDIGCVRLGCATEDDVADAFKIVTENAKIAGLSNVSALIQPMTSGLVEAFAGVKCDLQFGPTISFGIGGVFIEIMKDVVTEMAPVTRDLACVMIDRIKASPLLKGARGRPRADIDALADLLVNLSLFAARHANDFRALDLNPIIVGEQGKGVVAVDLAFEIDGDAKPR
jgi:acetyltransferase